ncbi:MAG: MFS transporter [Dongiaceae bacterium]
MNDVTTPRGAGAAQIPWAPLAGVIAMVAIFAVAQGLTYPLLSFILERQGASAGLIGLSAAMTPLGLIAGSTLIPPLTRRFGAGPLALACAILAGTSLALIGWTRDVVPWFPLRFAIGLAIGPLFVLSEVWLIALSPPQRRGRILGLYTAAVSAGFAAGPLSLMLVGTEGWPPFLIGIGAFVVCTLWLAAILRRLPALGRDGGTASVRTVVRSAPTLLFAVFTTAAFEQGLLSLLPVYGLSYGIGERSLAALLAVLIAGNIALQVPFGLAAERWTARSVSIACALATLVGCLLLPLLIATPLVWPLCFLWGAVSFGVYTLALIELGERFSGAMLIAANAAFALVWGVGGIAGPPATGAAMDLVGVQGLPAVLGLLYLALVLARLRR